MGPVLEWGPFKLTSQGAREGRVNLQASHSDQSPAAAKGKAFADATRKFEVLHWIIQMAHERGLFTARQYAYTSEQMTEPRSKLTRPPRSGRFPPDEHGGDH